MIVVFFFLCLCTSFAFKTKHIQACCNVVCAQYRSPYTLTHKRCFDSGFSIRCISRMGTESVRQQARSYLCSRSRSNCVHSLYAHDECARCSLRITLYSLLVSLFSSVLLSFARCVFFGWSVCVRLKHAHSRHTETQNFHKEEILTWTGLLYTYIHRDKNKNSFFSCLIFLSLFFRLQLEWFLLE